MPPRSSRARSYAAADKMAANKPLVKLLQFDTRKLLQEVFEKSIREPIWGAKIRRPRAAPELNRVKRRIARMGDSHPGMFGRAHWIKKFKTSPSTYDRARAELRKTPQEKSKS
jgi:hypothetical protein